MKIFNKYYLFKDDISLLDRRFFFSLVAIALTNVFTYKFIVSYNTNISFAIIDYIMKNLIIFIGAVVLSIVHFVLYYRHLKNNLICIVKENGITTIQNDFVYLVPWSLIDISHTSASVGAVMTSLYYKNNNQTNNCDSITQANNVLIKNKNFEFKQHYLFGINENFYHKLHNNKINQFKKWKKNKEGLNTSINIQQCNFKQIARNLGVILFGYSLMLYLLGFCFIVCIDIIAK